MYALACRCSYFLLFIFLLLCLMIKMIWRETNGNNRRQREPK